MKNKILIMGFVCLFFISCTTTGPKKMYTTNTTTGEMSIPVEYIGGLDTLNKKTKGYLYITNSSTKFVSEVGIVYLNMPTSSISAVYVGDEVKHHFGKTLARWLLIGPFALFIKDKAEVLAIEITEEEKNLVIHPIFKIKVGTGAMLKRTIQVKSRFAATKKQWENAITADSTLAYEEFLKQYPDSKFAKEARLRLKKLYVMRDWKNAETADSISKYDEFLKQYPDSEFAEEARSRLNNLKKEQPEKHWETVITADSTSAYEEFLKQHPDSKFAKEARSRLNYLKKEKPKKDKIIPEVVKDSILIDIPRPSYPLFLNTNDMLTLYGKNIRASTTRHYLYRKKKSFEWMFNINEESLNKNYRYDLVMASMGKSNVLIEIVLKIGKQKSVLGKDTLEVGSTRYQHYRGQISGSEIITNKGDQVILRITVSGSDFGIEYGFGKSSISILKSIGLPTRVTDERKKALIWVATNNKWGIDSDIFSGFMGNLDLVISSNINANWNFGWGLTKSGRPYLLKWNDRVFTVEEISIEKAKELDIKERSVDFKTLQNK